MGAKVGLDRARVVATAATLVDADGLDALTMSRLASCLGVRYQSLSPYVGSRCGLLSLLQERYLCGLEAAVTEAAIGRAGRDALEAVAAAHLDYDHAHPGLLSVHWALGGRPDAADGSCGAAGVVRAVLAHYDLAPEDAEHWQRILIAAMLGFSLVDQADLLCAGPDAASTHRLVLDVVIDAIEGHG